MDTVCISKSDFNKLAKTIGFTMQICPNSSLISLTFRCLSAAVQIWWERGDLKILWLCVQNRWVFAES